MISIIISSASPDLLRDVRSNIEDTVGIPYEIIAFDNSKGENGLCKLYNEGVRQAKFDLLCFMHEDVQIQTIDWGKVIVGHFENYPNLGLVGLAGSKYKSAIPLGWDSLNLTSNYLNIIQGYKHQKKEPVHEYQNPENVVLTEVVCLDGVWFCCPKQVAEEFPFDEIGLSGFHGYDLDFSLAVGQKYKVAVTFQVLITHFSEGRYSPDWFRDIYYLHRKWRHILPLNIDSVSTDKLLKTEELSFKYILQTHHDELSIKEAFDILNASLIKTASLVKYLSLSLRILRTFTKARKKKALATFF